MELINKADLEEYIIRDNCDEGCGYIDERDIDSIPIVKAIPKADYKARLKADMVAMLKELQLEIEELDNPITCDYAGSDCTQKFAVIDLIQEKIKTLEEQEDGK